MNQVLTREEMRLRAPSIFATAPAERTSELYQQYPTSKIVDLMEKEGWLAVKAQEQRINIVERAGFQKHIIRFRSQKDVTKLDAGSVAVGSEIFEVILVNSHDGRSCYEIRAGLYRLVCSNGLVVGNDSFSMKVRHIGNTPREVITASMKMVKEMPKIMNNVEQYKNIQLSDAERDIFANSAYLLKWQPEQERFNDTYDPDEPGEGIRFQPRELLSVRRESDFRSDLWSTYNVVQENIMKGRKVSTDKGVRKVRAVKSIKEDMKLNKALWNLTEEMAKLKKAK